MKHSVESIKKAMDSLKTAMDKYMKTPYSELRLHISAGNKKIGRVYNFSMAPGITCPNCAGCLPYCYDVKAVLQYKNVVNARAENTAMMYMNMSDTFAQIDAFITRTHRRNKFFRWHVSGDIINYEYLCNMVWIAKRHPEWTFWTYTKAYHIVNKFMEINGADSIPSNLSIMFSVWNGMACPNPFRMPTFTCIQEGMEPAPGEWSCPGNCDICLSSGHGCPFRESAHVYEH